MVIDLNNSTTTSLNSSLSLSQLGDPSCDIMFMLQNIRSLRKNFDKLVCHIQTLNKMPSLIFLSEIWIHDYEIDNYSISGFKLFANCNNDYRAGGVAVYVKDDLNVKVSNSFQLRTADLLLIDVFLGNFKVTVACIYRLQTYGIGLFLDEFSSFLCNIKSNNLFVLGDFNINILNNCALVDDYKLLMSSNGLLSVVNVPTRISIISSTCIDHVFYRSSNIVVNSSIEDLCITDHCAVFVKLVFNNELAPPTKGSRIEQKVRINYELLNSLLVVESWSTVLAIPDISVAFDMFTSVLSNYISHCKFFVNPIRKFYKLKPWMNNSLLFMINKKNRLSRKLKKQPCNLGLRNHFYSYTKILNKCIKETKNKYYLRKFQKVSGNSKQQWSVLDEILNKETRARNEINELLDDHNNVRISSSVDIANCFNNYFCNVVSIARQSFNGSSGLYDSSILLDHNSNISFFFRPISASELFFIINSLEDKHSTDLFGLSSATIKRISFNIVDILCVLFNRSITEGKFPESLKVAKVIPLFKKGDRLSASNYRPISILSVVSKIFEKAVKARMVEFLNSFHYFSNCQFGFRAGYGTEDALLELMNPLHEGLNSSSTVAGLFVDITKAFDMVDHPILLDKLWDIGFRGCVHNWFRSFISNRSQKVICRDSLSRSMVLEAGVPQGSVLGPILFLIYINSIFKQNFKGKVIAFADDMAFAYTCSNYSSVVSFMNHDLRTLSKSFAAHKLLLSAKTKAILFDLYGKNSFNNDIVYHDHSCPINGTCLSTCFPIESVTKIKYLGLNVDCRLDWKYHVLEVKNALLSGIRQMYLLRSHCPPGILKIFYHALIESRLRYGICCWGGTYMETIKPLIMAQKHIIRLMHFKNRSNPSWPLFLRSMILPLKHLYVFKVMNVYFEISGNRHLSCHNYILRNTALHYRLVPKFYKTHFFNYFLVTAPTIFNKLPFHLRSLYSNNKKSKSKLSYSLKDWLFQLPTIDFLFVRVV